jgi:hypothetical protein
MANMASMVEYDRLYPIAIKNPYGEDTGIVINVVSKDSKRVVSALRQAQSEYWAAMAAGGEGVVAPDVERITLVNCIDSWDWGSESWDHIEGSGVASLADREYLIDHPNAKWIKDNLAVGTANIENFTQPSQKSARRGSKKT